jgi:hypothetical protein
MKRVRKVINRKRAVAKLEPCSACIMLTSRDLKITKTNLMMVLPVDLAAQ